MYSDKTNLCIIIVDLLSGKPFLITQKGQSSTEHVKQAIMVEVVLLKFSLVLLDDKNSLLTFDLLGLSKMLVPFFHWALLSTLVENTTSL